MKKSNMSGVLVLLVFAVFMVSVLLVLLSGADTVQRLTQRDQRSYHRRTAVQYISTRVRQSDLVDAVDTGSSDDISMLILTESINGRSYQTKIYCYDGYLREMFCAAGLEIEPEFGEEIVPMNGFEAHRDGNTVRIVLSMPDGSTEEMFLLLRSEGGSVL